MKLFSLFVLMFFSAVGSTQSLENQGLTLTLGRLQAGSVPGYITGAPPQFLLVVNLEGKNSKNHYKEVKIRSLRLGSVATGEERNLNRIITIKNDEIQKIMAEENMAGYAPLIVAVRLYRMDWNGESALATNFFGLSNLSSIEEPMNLNDGSTIDRKSFGDPTYANLQMTVRASKTNE